MKLFVSISIAVLLSVSVSANDADIQSYMAEFGYYNPSAFDTRDVTESLKEFQATFGLPITGRADNETTTLIATPRCGRPDNENEGNGLSYYSPKWRKNKLTYYFHNYTPDLYKKDVLSLTAKAFKFWSDVTPLTFGLVEREGDIVIAFGSKSHSDDRRQCRSSFDGKGKVLAHAFYPEDGRLHFDEDEKFAKSWWTIGGKNYLWIAVHEIGHILGLSHDTEDKGAIMYPYYRSFNSNMKLGPSDIRRIQNLYGK